MSDRPRFPILPPPLPRRLPPFSNETYASYLDRLARRNRLPQARLKDRVATPGLTTVQNLAALTRIRPEALVLAMPHLHPDPASVTLLRGRPRRLRQLACRRCARRRGHGEARIEVFARHEDVLCARHRLWLHHASSPSGQIPIGDHRILLSAARRHRRLIRLRGRDTTHTAFCEATEVVQHYARTIQHDPGLQDIYRSLVHTLDATHRPTLMTLACYPWAVALTAILIDTPRGHAWQTAPPGLRNGIRQRVATEVTGGYTPTGGHDAFMNLAERLPWAERSDTW